MDWLLVSLLILAPFVAMSDILPPPLPGDMPLHRIGYELVVEVLAASAAGIAAVRALVKRRWKIDELSVDERVEFSQKIDSVLSRLVDEVVNAHRANECERLDLIARARCQTDDPEVIRKTLDDAGWAPMEDQKDLLERVLSQSGDLRQALDGVPIELVNELLLPRLPPEIRVRHDVYGGSLWTTEEDRREVRAACHKHYSRPRPIGGNIFGAVTRPIKEIVAEHEAELAQAFVKIKEEMEKKKGRFDFLTKDVKNEKRIEGVECKIACEKCGEMISAKSRFCHYCGWAVSNVYIVCPLCGRGIDSHDCLSCNHLHPASAET